MLGFHQVPEASARSSYTTGLNLLFQVAEWETVVDPKRVMVVLRFFYLDQTRRTNKPSVKLYGVETGKVKGQRKKGITFANGIV